MTDPAIDKTELELLRSTIQSAFPDSVFVGPITSVDGRIEQELDEEQALYATLHGKKWSEITLSFVRGITDGVALLTDDAFSAFLPAWMMCALDDKKIRELMVYHFSPGQPSARFRRRIQKLTSTQRNAVLKFLTYCVHVETSPFIKEHARNAVAIVTSVSV